MIRNILKVLMIVFIITGCKQNEFEEALFRTRADPFDDVPEIDSFSREETIYLNWKADIAADIFYLMRAEDSTSLDWKCIYQGTSCEYIDTEIDMMGRYIYRLDKKRGEKLFKGNEYAYGVSADTRKDIYEFNDNEENATLLEVDMNCNLPCVKYQYTAKESNDEDWFYVVVPAHRKALITVNQEGLTSNQITNLMCMQPGMNPEQVINDKEFYLKNSCNEAKKMTFKVYPNVTTLFSNSTDYYSTLVYTVALVEINKYN